MEAAGVTAAELAAADAAVSPPVRESKPGIRTTEFWVTLFTNALGVFELLFGGLNVQNEYVVIALGVVNGLYQVSRGLAKQGIPAPMD